jgi:GNAT superfamily N-acetyltransferase
MKAELRKTLSDQDKSVIREFAAASPHSHIWQNPDSLPIYIRGGRSAYHFVAEEGNRIVAYGIFYVERSKLEAFSLRGPIFDTLDVGRASIAFLRKEFRKLGVGQLRISPYWAGPEAHVLAEVCKAGGLRPYYPKIGPYDRSGRVRLGGTSEELYSRFEQPTRKDVRRCLKAGFEISRIRCQDTLHAAHSLIEDLKTRKALSPMPSSEANELFHCILSNDELGAAFLARMAGRPVGTFWAARANKQVAIGIGYAVDTNFMRASFRSLSLGVPLWIEGMKWANEKGCEWFDMEGYDPNAKASASDYYVHQFKGQFRPQPIDLLGPHAGVCFWPRYYFYLGFRNW